MDWMIGVVDNEPIHTKAHRQGQSFTALQADIVGWTCVDCGGCLSPIVHRVMRR